MIEIKFRGWNIPNNTMYYDIQDGLLCENEKGELVIGVSLGKLSKDAGTKMMQFSGMHMNSTGISKTDVYELDIIGEYVGGQYETVGIVKFDEDLSSWTVEKTNGGFDYLHEYQRLNSKYAIIGNVFENPELL